MLVSHDISMVNAYVNRLICVNKKVLTCPAHLHDVNQLRDIYGAGFKLVKHAHGDHARGD